ncbi:uncharacterized protein [Procambarus clarkii]|uniref:uncharacterized protein n=1 Tax=Procambarus clarkii TaxID=6728 RepID=UPI003742E04C
MRFRSRGRNSEYKLAMAEVGNSRPVSTLARPKVASNEQDLKWKEEAKPSSASRVDAANSVQSSEMAETVNTEGHVRPLAEKKVDSEEKEPKWKKRDEELCTYTSNLVHLFCSSERQASSKLSHHDGGACRDVGINDPNLSFPFTNLASHGENLGLSVLTEVRMDSWNENDVLTVIGDAVADLDVTVSDENEAFTRHTNDTSKSSQYWSSCYYSSAVEQRNEGHGPWPHQTSLYNNQEILTSGISDIPQRVTSRKNCVQICDGTLKCESNLDLQTVQDQIKGSSRLIPALNQDSKITEDQSCISLLPQTPDSQPYRPTRSQRGGGQHKTSSFQPASRPLGSVHHKETCSPPHITPGHQWVTPWGRRWAMGPVWVVWVLLLLPTMALADSDVQPSLAAPQHNLTVAAGRKAKLTCVVENLGSYKVAWTHYGLTGRAVLTVDSVVITKNQRVSLQKERGGASWSLLIKNVTTTDMGEYLCQVNTVPPQKLYFHITVVVPPVIVRPPEDVTVAEGDDVTLECDATGDPHPTLTWRREDGAPFSFNHTRVREAGGARLQLISVSREESGAFLCVASNGVPPAVSARVEVSVKFGPEMRGGAGVVWAEALDRSALVCRYRAWPTPTVTWTKDGALIEGSLETWEPWGTGTSTLVIPSVGPENFGHYRCTVANSLGSNSSMLALVELSTTTTTTTTTSTTTTTTTTTTTSTTTASPESEGDQYQLKGRYDGKVLEKTYLVPDAASSSSSSSSPPSWQHTTHPPGAASPTDAAPHRYVQEPAPPVDPRPRPLYPDAASTSAGEPRALSRVSCLLPCLLHLLDLLPCLLLLIH